MGTFIIIHTFIFYPCSIIDYSRVPYYMIFAYIKFQQSSIIVIIITILYQINYKDDIFDIFHLQLSLNSDFRPRSLAHTSHYYAMNTMWCA